MELDPVETDGLKTQITVCDRVKAWMAGCIIERGGEAGALGVSRSDEIVSFERALQSGYLLALLATVLGGPTCQGYIYPVSHTFFFFFISRSG